MLGFPYFETNPNRQPIPTALFSSELVKWCVLDLNESLISIGSALA